MIAANGTGPWELTLPYDRPPLSLNQRLSWNVRSKATAQLKHDTTYLARFLRLPKGLDYCEITLHYQPGVRRTRDSDNLFLTLKAVIDGLRDYGLVADDDHEHVEPRVRIHPVCKPARLWVSIADMTVGRS